MALIHSFSAAIVTAALSVSIAPALGADAADPSYQIKLRVSPHAVDENGLPTELEKDSGTVIEAANPTMSSVVTQNSWRVEIDGIKTDLEVTEIGGEFWVEISEEDGSRKDTIKKRAKLLNQLRADGFLMEEDAFKSQYILSRN